jgi:hypothetical protein
MMQPIKAHSHPLQTLATKEHYLFTLDDLHGALPELTRSYETSA